MGQMTDEQIAALAREQSNVIEMAPTPMAPSNVIEMAPKGQDVTKLPGVLSAAQQQRKVQEEHEREVERILALPTTREEIQKARVANYERRLVGVIEVARKSLASAAAQGFVKARFDADADDPDWETFKPAVLSYFEGVFGVGAIEATDKGFKVNLT